MIEKVIQKMRIEKQTAVNDPATSQWAAIEGGAVDSWGDKPLPAEEEKQLRNAITDICCAVDWEKQIAFGKTQARLMKRTNKSIQVMTVEELRYALKIATGFRQEIPAG